MERKRVAWRRSCEGDKRIQTDIQSRGRNSQTHDVHSLSKVGIKVKLMSPFESIRVLEKVDPRRIQFRRPRHGLNDHDKVYNPSKKKFYYKTEP